jgi:hypothetical protein
MRSSLAALIAAVSVVVVASPAAADSVAYGPYRGVSIPNGAAPIPGRLAFAADGSAYSVVITDEDEGGYELHRYPGHGKPTANTSFLGSPVTDVAVDPDSNVWVLTETTPVGDAPARPEVAEFAPGDPAHPIRTFVPTDITNPDAIAVDLDGDVALGGTGSLRLYRKDATGDATATWSVSGDQTGLTTRIGRLAINRAGEYLYTLGRHLGKRAVLKFDLGAPGGNVPPHVTLQGSHIQIDSATDLALGAADEIYVSRPHAVVEYKFNAKGNAVPRRVLSGHATQFADIKSLAVNGSNIAVIDYQPSTGSYTLREYRTLNPDRPDAVGSIFVSGGPTAKSHVVQWRTPLRDGGRTIHSYRLVFLHGSKKLKVASVAAAHHRYRIARSALPTGKITVSVQAVNAAGRSLKSATTFSVSR